jgi:hypothetical protein
MDKIRIYEITISYIFVNAEDTLIISVPVGENIIEFISNKCRKNEKYEILAICEVPECLGCRYKEPGQMAHMNHCNGCLHSPDFCNDCD